MKKKLYKENCIEIVGKRLIDFTLSDKVYNYTNTEKFRSRMLNLALMILAFENSVGKKKKKAKKGENISLNTSEYIQLNNTPLNIEDIIPLINIYVNARFLIEKTEFLIVNDDEYNGEYNDDYFNELPSFPLDHMIDMLEDFYPDDKTPYQKMVEVITSDIVIRYIQKFNVYSEYMYDRLVRRGYPFITYQIKIKYEKEDVVSLEWKKEFLDREKYDFSILEKLDSLYEEKIKPSVKESENIKDETIL